MIWQDMPDIERNNIKDQYESIRKQIKSLNAIKANDEKKSKYSDQENKKYNDKIIELQKQYNNIKVYYRCDYCNKEIKLSLDKIKTLIKNKAKPIFCNRKCSGIYYANKSHEGKTEEEIRARKDKISKTLKVREIHLSEEEKKIRKINLNKYWKEMSKEERSLRNKNLINKIKETKLKRYGDENYNNSEQISKTYKEHYNINNPASNWNHISAENLAIIRDKEKFKQYILSIPLDERCIYTIARGLNIARSYCSNLLNKYQIYEDPEVKIHRNISKPQLDLQEYISSICDFDIIINTKKIITPYELDIYIPEKQVAIEYNGNYYHTTNNVDKKTHYKKSKLCEEKGIRLIHIFEYEWENERQRPILENIIKNALGVNLNKIYARNLNIEVKESKCMKEFFETNNIQGFRGGKFAICLVDKKTKEIYMSYMMGSAFFGKGKYEWEVIRGATKLGYTVVGGASKIWKYFKKTYNPNNCVYYIDYNYFNGNSIQNLDKFELIETQFSFKNYFVNENKVKNRDPIHHKEIKQLEEQGLIYPIYNAGTKVYVWKK